MAGSSFSKSSPAVAFTGCGTRSTRARPSRYVAGTPYRIAPGAKRNCPCTVLIRTSPANSSPSRSAFGIMAPFEGVRFVGTTCLAPTNQSRGSCTAARRVWHIQIPAGSSLSSLSKRTECSATKRPPADSMPPDQSAGSVSVSPSVMRNHLWGASARTVRRPPPQPAVRAKITTGIRMRIECIIRRGAANLGHIYRTVSRLPDAARLKPSFRPRGQNVRSMAQVMYTTWR